MDEIKKIWTDKYRINWYEADANNGLSLTSLCNYLQVSAFRHAQHLGFDYTRKDGFDGLWVLVRLLIKMDKYPEWEDEITVDTWHRGAEGMVAMRDYMIRDDKGEKLGAVSSYWFVLDPATRRAVVPEVSEEARSTIHTEKALEENPERILIKKDMPLISTLTASYTDLDKYNHVNNTRYIDWILNLFPPDMHKQYVISSFMIEFLSEVLYGEEIRIFASVDPLCSFVKGIRSGDDKPIFRAKLIWRKR